MLFGPGVIDVVKAKRNNASSVSACMETSRILGQTS
jgi:hypothetical protein